MYEPKSHALLNEILRELEPDLNGHDMHYFYIRIGANFYAIYSLFHKLYGHRQDFKAQLYKLVECLALNYTGRSPRLREKDFIRERDYNWFMSQKWTGMALYAGGFGGNLQGVRKHADYFTELGINLVHIMPILRCPSARSDGGYAVSDYRQIDPRMGSMEDLEDLIEDFAQRDILSVLDVVVNHTSDEHEWAMQAKQGEQKYQDYYYLFEDRTQPDRFEETMLEVFPNSAPGNFTWNEEMQRWVMTVFHNYQWDLNYRNPAVFIEMIDIILFWANKGADIMRLDAVAFLWKEIGTLCQNEREAHLLLQLMKDCCQVTAPGVLFIAEAIVAPLEVVKYFGEDAVIDKECEIAYNATYMALLWDAIATRNSKLLTRGLNSLPLKLEGSTWLNYVRCHDDIGLGFDNADIAHSGYDPESHRRFLIDYYTGKYPASSARGMPFAQNDKTGDARISGSLASLAGLEAAIENNEPDAIDASIERILLLHSLILSFGGIPLIYYGDELGFTNDYGQLQNPSLANDNRWIHRPRYDWNRAENRHRPSTVEGRIFHGISRMIAARRELSAFADHNNRILLHTGNDHVFGFIRPHPENRQENVLVLANFDDQPQAVFADTVCLDRFDPPYHMVDMITNTVPPLQDERIALAPRQALWLMKA